MARQIPIILVDSISAPPVKWKHLINNVLISQSQIQNRIRSLANEIESDFKPDEIVVIPILKGTILFAADLCRNIHLPVRIEFVTVSSYQGTTTPGPVNILNLPNIEIHNKNVLVVDDILDTGQTMKKITKLLHDLKPAKLKTCVLLQKDKTQQYLPADYTGFIIADIFVVGYGLDHQELLRNLPFIATLNDPSNK